MISHKVGNRSGIGGQRRSAAVTQRPTRREPSSEPFTTRVRAVVGYVPAFLKLVLAVVFGILFFAGYRAAASASFFRVRNVEVQGTARVSPAEVKAIVREQAEKTGVWKADLKLINSSIEGLPWVRTAVVSRVLPDGIRVRISERLPRAVVRTGAGRFRWVDEDAVLLGEMLPTDQIPNFFLRGLSEESADTTPKENRERVQKFLELQRDWDALGLSERVSEVNVLDVRDIRAQLAGDNSQIEIRLGSQDHGKRLKDALEVLDAQRQTPRGSLISYIDMSQGRRAIVGLISGVQTTAQSGALPSSPAESATENAPEDSAAPLKPRATVQAQRVDNKKRERKENQKKSDKKEKAKEAGRRR
ncbi:MAG TPA: FtsQ-type POTRA domain-containing protein [Pyrinomonadaceae bacterium]|nr:FtsQ-type POTRA domain-containing protein [Pyrinomonadaceae bacterium]